MRDGKEYWKMRVLEKMIHNGPPEAVARHHLHLDQILQRMDIARQSNLYEHWNRKRYQRVLQEQAGDDGYSKRRLYPCGTS